jgi:hypothetical protein
LSDPGSKSPFKSKVPDKVIPQVETTIISSFDKFKLSQSIPNGLNKIVSFKPLYHPIFPPGTFILASKTNHIGIVQLNDDDNLDSNTDTPLIRASKSHRGSFFSMNESASVISSSTSTAITKKEKDNKSAVQVISETLYDFNLNLLLVSKCEYLVLLFTK